jgi:EAL domain-containing protein (putative c-di-GMP-specific phosphodiesterase class I)
MLSMAHHLRKEVTAEGVESQAQWIFCAIMAVIQRKASISAHL